jgi:hypothetical protein
MTMASKSEKKLKETQPEKQLWLTEFGDSKNPFEIHDSSEEGAVALFICPTHAEAVTWIKNLGDHDHTWKKFFVYDQYHEVGVTIKDGEVAHIESRCYFETSVDKESKEAWGVKLKRSEDDEYYEPDCTACGDGGCPHCEPSRFIEGHIY